MLEIGMQPLHPGLPPPTSLWGNVIVFWLSLSACVSDIELAWEDEGWWAGSWGLSWRGAWDRTDRPGLSLSRREASVCLKWMRVYDDKYDWLWLSPGKGKSVYKHPELPRRKVPQKAFCQSFLIAASHCISLSSQECLCYLNALNHKMGMMAHTLRQSLQKTKSSSGNEK